MFKIKKYIARALAFLYSGTCSLWHLNHCAFKSYSIDCLKELKFIWVDFYSSLLCLKSNKYPVIEFPVVFACLSVCIKRSTAKLHLDLATTTLHHFQDLLGCSLKYVYTLMVIANIFNECFYVQVFSVLTL